jgi:DNA-binding NarL/FixJ family response regulator
MRIFVFFFDMKRSYTIAIVDGHRIVTGGLKHLLSKLEDLTVVSCFATGESVLKYKQLKKIDILLLDVFLPDSNGIDLCLKLKKEHPKLIILAMSSEADRSIVLQMVQAGASGYLLKSAPIEEFYDCIRQSDRTSPFYSKGIRAILDRSSEDALKNIPRLTRREKEVLLLLIAGKQTQEIADILFLSFLTVQTHRRNLLNKFQVKNVIELINFVRDNNLL